MKKTGLKIRLQFLLILKALAVIFVLIIHADSFAANAVYHTVPTIDGLISPGEYPTTGKVLFSGDGGHCYGLFQ
ncbi:MAG TPA: hypothetical protein PK874_02685 [Desulfobacteraceae bacterium]|nr:hypothetical protein [Desulfobacteraceae bacterium]HPJ69172.1 hypothetical protein [Desulfobacteraceae bacterium]HPQ29781.1 hypothetical protein [Desulfobacteraceae bacterium]